MNFNANNFNEKNQFLKDMAEIFSSHSITNLYSGKYKSVLYLPIIYCLLHSIIPINEFSINKSIKYD